MSSEFIDAEFTVVELPENYKKLDRILWRDADYNFIPVTELDDTHLRNIALVLMDMGYVKWSAPDSLRISWLSVLKMEWQRRQYKKKGLRLKSKDVVGMKEIEAHSP
jgi:hypothetical protein